MTSEIMQKQGYRSLTLEGDVFTIKKLGGREGFKTFITLTKLIGPSLASLYDNGDDMAALEGAMVATEAVTLLSRSVDEDKLLNIAEAMLKSLQKNGEMIDFDDLDFHEIFHLLEFAVKENFTKNFTKWLKVKGFSLPSVSQKPQQDTSTEE